MKMTTRQFGPDGYEFASATTSDCPDERPAQLTKKRRNRNLVKIEDGIEFDTYCAGYWSAGYNAGYNVTQEDAEYMNAIRTRVTFAG